MFDSTMKCVLYLLSEIFLANRCALSYVVQLNGKQSVRRNGSLDLNCSADAVPEGFAADILVNSKTYTNMRFHNKTCFSAIIGQECTENTCSCSKRGTWFTHKYYANLGDPFVTIACEMRFGWHGKVSDIINIKIIDMIGPEIEANPALPLNVGEVATLICKVVTKEQNINLTWNCVHTASVDNRLISLTTHLSEIQFKVQPYYQDTVCTCVAHVESLTESALVLLQVTYIPNIQMEEYATCNSSSSIELSCWVSNKLPDFGFNKWQHSFQGYFIRTLNGATNGNRSTLIIQSCSFHDAGEYMCIAWNRFSEDTMRANRSTSLIVNGPPQIVSEKTSKKPNSVFEVQFYSSSEIIAPVWYYNNVPVDNSTQFLQEIYRRSVSILINKKHIICDGYIAKLTSNTAINGDIGISVQNNYGQTKTLFTIKSAYMSFNLRTLLWGMITVGILLLALTATSIVMKRRIDSNTIYIVGPLEHLQIAPVYYSAPSRQDVEHIYDRTNPNYLELIGFEPQHQHINFDFKVESAENSENSSTHYEEIQ